MPPPRVAGRAWLSVVLGIGCAGVAADRELVLEVTNALGRSISAIEGKACADPEEAFVALEDSGLEAGESRRFVLPDTCLDLVAYDGRRRLVGQQRGLRLKPGTRWTLRR